MVGNTAFQTQALSAPGKVALLAKPGGPNTGVGRYVAMMEAGLRQQGVDVARVAPVAPPLPGIYPLLGRLKLDLRAFLANYPVWASLPAAAITHVTSQNLASLLLFRRPPGRTVVTVHDIIPYILRDSPAMGAYRSVAERLFDRMAMAGLRRADALIADSAYTKRTLVRHLGIPEQRIAVVHLGIDHQRFRMQLPPHGLRARYGLPNDRRFIIYVGSEDPRKNLPTLIEALALLRRAIPDVALIKVGRAHFERERLRLKELAARHGVQDAVYFLDDVPEDDLPALYGLASVCAMPSHYEGFGFPVLEAMACGTPVVCADATSLPELAGDAALRFSLGPNEVADMVVALARALDPLERAEMRRAGLARAASFRWEKTVQEVMACYHEVGGLSA
ncbi:glycosyltransferase family 4 protein [Chloroflexia bacterium SDU3-3]|nr:glycosyltransferase family 4 protein [Chloroflexia bacterium SDU3-3]